MHTVWLVHLVLVQVAQSSRLRLPQATAGRVQYAIVATPREPLERSWGREVGEDLRSPTWWLHGCKRLR